MLIELNENETDNMSFELMKREIANNLSVERTNFDPNDSTLKTSEMARECRNCLARESYTRKMVHEINYPVIENSESVREQSAKNQRAKRLKVNHHASNTARMEQYNSTTVNVHYLEDEIENRALCLLNDILTQQGKSLKDFPNMPIPIVVNEIENFLIAEELDYNQEILTEFVDQNEILLNSAKLENIA
ncbi:8703_t:CDS:2 [Racocetra fulgida]|uniref:8703_t:CDS:1 n=1 Tax=Racocetra fulgida TaxID=60492 RepID=A0A9N9GJE7_9GLOM|nr:8703_t:CDS:2 [Racocetra fulgida]